MKLNFKYKAEVFTGLSEKEVHEDLLKHFKNKCDYDSVTMCIAELKSYVKHKYDGKIELEVCYE